MAFRSDTAAATLGSVLDELARTWKRLSPELQGALDALIRAHGPQIADRSYDRFNVVSRVIGLLDALWQLQVRLPAQAVRMLQAGQAAEAGFRGIASISDADAPGSAPENEPARRLPRFRRPTPHGR